MPLLTAEHIEEMKKVLDSIRENKDTNDIAAPAIKARWFPNGDITAAITNNSDDPIAQLEIKLYLLTQCD